MRDDFINTRSITNNKLLQLISILALLGLAVAYIHAELYTVYGPFIKVRDWGVPPTWALIVQEMRIKSDSGSSEFIPILEADFLQEFIEYDDANLESHVNEHVMESQYVRIDYTLSSAAYVQLSYSYYPYLRVMIDGVEVRKFPTAFGLIGIVAPEGSHVIEIEPYLSPLRQVTLGINVATFLLLGLLYVRSFRRIDAMTL
jgi:hypothetical protein